MTRTLKPLLQFCLALLLLFIVPGMVGCGSDDDDDIDFSPPSGNRAPTAAAGADRMVPTGTAITLDGSASSDPDGDPLAFLWEIVLRPADSNAVLSNPTAERPTITPDARGEYRITLVVNDGQLASQPDLVILTAVPPGPNSNPEAVVIAPAGQTVHVGTLVTLEGAQSSDPDGEPLFFEWTLISQPSTSMVTLAGTDTTTPSFFPQVAGNYAIQLTVSDTRGGIDTEDILILVVPAGENISPIADAGPDLRVDPGTVVQLDGSGSRDPDGDTLRFEWSFISRPQGSSAVLPATNTAAPLFTPDAEGIYRILLTVTDLRGATSTDEVTVAVLPPGANQPPVAEAGRNRFVAIGSVVTLDGSGSRDPDGDPLTFSWTLLPPGGSVAFLAGADTPTPSFIADRFGDYLVQLNVSDPQGATGSTSLIISAR